LEVKELYKTGAMQIFIDGDYKDSRRFRMNAKVEEVLNQVRPMLQRDGGNVELVEVTPEGIVKVKLTGACGSCPMSTMTLKMGIEAALKEQIPEVVEVQQVR
jgi:Fe-S cluster biogenesis protein NfuA